AAYRTMHMFLAIEMCELYHLLTDVMTRHYSQSRKIFNLQLIGFDPKQVRTMAHSNGFPKYSDNQNLNEKIRDWIKWDKNEKTKEEIENLVKRCEWNTLGKRLTKRLNFGTAGLRGVMHAGFNAMNDLVVIQSAQGLLKYILQCFPNENDRRTGIVVGYDGRYNSKRFAELTACVFLNAGVPVLLFGQMIATPFIPFTILEKKCLTGVMVTASHNPKEDNGYKVYWGNGAQIISPHDKMIEKFILQNLEPYPSSWNLDILSSPLLTDPYDEIITNYYEKLRANIPKDILENYNKTSDFQCVYTAMHGVGFVFVEKAMEAGNLKAVITVKEQSYPDPEFPTVKFPNPEEGASSLELSMKLADSLGVDVILANDPDADRLACAERNKKTNKWKVFTGNELGALLGWWAFECHKQLNPNVNFSDCYTLASTVSSKILKAIANVEGFQFIETLTGFKWMGNISCELMATGKSIVFAFEEAIGFMVTPTVLDKDGVSAACHLASLGSYLRHSNMSFEDKLNEIYNKYGYHFTINSYYICHEPEVISAIFNKIRNRGVGDKETTDYNYPTSILDGKYKIESVRDLTTGIDTSQPDNKATLPSSKSSQMITFSFENGVVVTLRTSGTEPKIKYYSEMCGKPQDKNWEELRKILVEMIEAIVEEFLQPHHNKLIPRD
ncbi:Phosphoglucomutase-2, partial [Pseudolycoriella hygida]